VTHRMTTHGESAMIEHLNDVPEWLIERARGLSDADAARRLLMAHTSPDGWPVLKPFVEDVVIGGQSARNWLRGQVLVPDFSLAELLTLSCSALWAPLGGLPTRRIVPDLDDWRGNVSWVAAPARLLPDADYRFTPPANSTALGNVATEEVSEPANASCRWIAARLAMVARDERAIHSIGDATAMAYPLPPVPDWSECARRAVLGLSREYQELGPPTDSTPGLRGPDAWYS
jgi:hypothetical protein